MNQPPAPKTPNPACHTGRWRLVPVVFALLFFLRMEPFFSEQLCFSDFDETEVGILTKDLLDGLVAPVSDYLLHTNGFLVEGFLLLPFFKLGGKTLLMIRVFALLISLLTLLAAVRLARRTSGTSASVIAMGFFLFGTEAFFRLGASSRPSHKEFCLLLFCQLLVFAETFRRNDFFSNRRAFLFGLLAGFGLFFSWQNTPVLVALALAATCCLPGRQWPRLFVWTGGAVLGFLPGWLTVGGAYGLTGAAVVDYAAQWRALWTILLPTSVNVDHPGFGRAVLLLLAASWSVLAVRTLARRRKAKPSQEPPAPRVGLALDWFLLFFPPLWLAATLRQGWPLTADNIRYALPLTLTAWLIPVRLITGKKTLFAGALLAALLLVGQWRTLPHPGPWLDPTTRLTRAACAAGYRGYWYPVFLQRSAARVWAENPTPAEFDVSLSQVAPAWRAAAIWSFGYHQGRHSVAPDEARRQATALSPREAAAWREGYGFGAAEERLIRRESRAALAAMPLTEPLEQEAYYRGTGHALFGDLIGLTPSPPRFACLAGEAPCEPRDAVSLTLTRQVARSAPAEQLTALVAGFGLATADRELAPEQVPKMLANLLPECPWRLRDFYFGYGLGLARFRYTMTERWFEPSGRLCPRLPDEWQDACREGFTIGLRDWGAVLDEEETEFGWLYRLADAWTAPAPEMP